MLYKIQILGSSSKGCAYVLYFDNGIVIQLDAGCENKKPEEVNRVYISHLTHKDHDKYIKQFDQEKVILPLENSATRNFDNSYFAFEVPHKVLNNGYLIKEDDEKIGYITDCGDSTKLWGLDLSQLNYLFIECNWDYYLIKNGEIKPAKHASYAFSDEGHMSNKDCLELIKKTKVNPNCKIIFVHHSTHHAKWDKTYKIFDELPNKKHAAKKGEIIYVKSWKII